MDTITKNIITIEHHCLQLRYASLRLHPRGLLERLMASMQEHGQLVPVVVVPQETNQWVLIDGYLRAKALQRIGQDTLHAEIWRCDLVEALLMLLTQDQSRPWDMLEEALLLRELHIQHGLSQSSLAKRMGRDKSWVSRRLALLEYMSESILQAILQGKLSLWMAARIVAPLARANATHGESILNYLLHHHHSTRELQAFYDHYQQSNHPQRAHMLKDPALFFKAQKSLVLEKQTQRLQAGPEGQWHAQWRVVQNTLTSLIALAPSVLLNQDSQKSAELVDVLHVARTQFDLLTHTVRRFTDAHERHAADHYQSAPKGA